MFFENDCGLKNAAGVDKSNLASFKSDFEKLGINELEKYPRGLNSLKSKEDDLDVGKMKTVSIDLKELSNVVTIEKSKYNADKIDLDKKVKDVKIIYQILMEWLLILLSMQTLLELKRKYLIQMDILLLKKLLRTILLYYYLRSC